jgi:hypothetical protein
MEVRLRAAFGVRRLVAALEFGEFLQAQIFF